MFTRCLIWRFSENGRERGILKRERGPVQTPEESISFLFLNWALSRMMGLPLRLPKFASSFFFRDIHWVGFLFLSSISFFFSLLTFPFFFSQSFIFIYSSLLDSSTFTSVFRSPLISLVFGLIRIDLNVPVAYMCFVVLSTFRQMRDWLAPGN